MAKGKSRTRRRAAVGMPRRNALRGRAPKMTFTKGFKSKAQWRRFFADPKLRRYARKKAHATPGGKVVRYRRLPARKGVKKSAR
ncbi:hypothetical protein [Mycolicibacterium goodii]|uniref:Uncharacterized protein n=1 Tax=Mycolicibacterium goodii TaxID=134601 RepID=A0ABS6HRH8_MYCGD|nr:hypothetical protein [Mycolicibacterium goodii]MBU8824135.1 hypothetical protein [Mycolicibacterium goodii]MBU8838082.1 hypothetical protein [Mycolicibacterium goodii]